MAHSSLKTHRKLEDLMDALSISRPLAVGLLECLWWKVYETDSIGPNGFLAGWTERHVARAAYWDRDPETDFVKALLHVGLLDKTRRGLFIHDYARWAPTYVKERWRRAGLWPLKLTTAKGAGEKSKETTGKSRKTVDRALLVGGESDEEPGGEPVEELASEPADDKTNQVKDVHACVHGVPRCDHAVVLPDPIRRNPTQRNPTRPDPTQARAREVRPDCASNSDIRPDRTGISKGRITGSDRKKGPQGDSAALRGAEIPPEAVDDAERAFPEPESKRSIFTVFEFKLCAVFGLQGDQAEKQRKAFRAVARRIVDRPPSDRHRIFEELVELAKAKMKPGSGLMQPIRAWQAEVNKRYPK